MRVVVTLPLPSRDLSPNRTRPGAWRPRQKATKAARAMAQVVCRQAMRDAGCEGMSKASYSLTFFCDTIKARVTEGYAPRDEGNAVQSCKAYLDGCVDAGIVPDDSRRYLSLKGVTIHPSKDSKKQAQVLIVFEADELGREAA